MTTWKGSSGTFSLEDWSYSRDGAASPEYRRAHQRSQHTAAVNCFVQVLFAQTIKINFQCDDCADVGH